jgi:hypothetical protein
VAPVLSAPGLKNPSHPVVMLDAGHKHLLHLSARQSDTL